MEEQYNNNVEVHKQLKPRKTRKKCESISNFKQQNKKFVWF